LTKIQNKERTDTTSDSNTIISYSSPSFCYLPLLLPLSFYNPPATPLGFFHLFLMRLPGFLPSFPCVVFSSVKATKNQQTIDIGDNTRRYLFYKEAQHQESCSHIRTHKRIQVSEKRAQRKSQNAEQQTRQERAWLRITITCLCDSR